MNKILKFDEFLINYNNLLEPHLFIEFYCGDENRQFYYSNENRFNKNEILEKHGVFNNCETLAWKLLNIAKSSSDKTINVHTPECNFTKNIILVITEDGLTGYAFSKTKTLKNSEKFQSIQIQLNKKSINLGALMHELQHAYEDYNLRKQGNTLEKVAKDLGYFEMTNNNDPIEKMVGSVMYMLVDFERNAFIGTIKGELLEYDGTFLSVNDVLEYIKRTNFYKNYKLVFCWCEQFLEVKDDKHKELILKYANKLSNNKFKSYDGFKRWINNKMTTYKSKLKNIVSKVAYDCYVDKLPHTLGTSDYVLDNE